MIQLIGLSLIIGLGLASISSSLNPGYGFTPSLWPALVGIMVASFGFIYNQAERHAAKFARGITINHTLANTYRILILVCLSLIINSYNFHWVKVANLVIFGCFWVGLLFNLSLNHFRFLPWDYIAKPGKGQAITDTIFSWFGKWGGKILILVELAGMAVSGWVYCLS